MRFPNALQQTNELELVSTSTALNTLVVNPTSASYDENAILVKMNADTLSANAMLLTAGASDLFQVHASGLTTVHQGGLEVDAGGATINTGGLTTNSKITVTAGGADITGGLTVSGVVTVSGPRLAHSLPDHSGTTLRCTACIEPLIRTPKSFVRRFFHFSPP